MIVNDGQVTNQDTERPDLTTASALRLLLDRAATVEEALSLLVEYAEETLPPFLTLFQAGNCPETIPTRKSGTASLLLWTLNGHHE
ncbi:MAG: hypothetical protein PUC36_01340 [Clostridiales bacterium]|nr:hypothetical protein [Clostridiales bacterium]